MIANALPVATSVNTDKGMLIYSEDGVTLKRVSVRHFTGDVNYGSLYSNDVEPLPFWNEIAETCPLVTFAQGYGMTSS